MDRRRFLTALGATPLLACGAGTAAAAPQISGPVRSAACLPPWLTKDVWENAFDHVAPEYASSSLMRHLPEGLRGTLYRNGPALMRLGNDTQYHHWLDGDGMVHAFRFTEDRVEHLGRLVATSKLAAELEAGRRLYGGFGSNVENAFQGPPDMNVANINTLLVGNELLALWEGGEPYALDPATLQTKGRKSWSPNTQGLPFSAHPKVDADGTVWSFGYLPGAGMLALYRIVQGQLAGLAMVPAPNADMIHDFTITERYLVFVLMPYRFTPDPQPGRSFIGHYRWQAGQPGYVLVVDKATLAVVRQIECPPIGVFHLGNAWETGNTLHFGLVQYEDFAGTMQELGTVLASANQSWPANGWVDLEVDLAAGKVRLTPGSARLVEFPRYDARRIGQASRYTYLMASRRPDACPLFGMNTVQRIDHQTGHVAQFQYSPFDVAEEHVFVPRPGGSREDDGWLVGTVYNWLVRRTSVNVFDAAHLGDGPIAHTMLPYGLPLGLHGNFHPAP